MHQTSYDKVERFVEVYLGPFRAEPLAVLDFGSQQVTPNALTHRSLFDQLPWTYTGLDMVAGLNVDIAVADPYDWTEVEDDQYDLVVSGQVLEHVEQFWVSVFEIGRVMRPGGIAVIVVPSTGPQHRYPVDCWRFYTDGMAAIASWVEFDVLDTYTDWGRGHWQDSVVVMRKPMWDEAGRERFRQRGWHQRSARSPDTPPPGPLTESKPSVLADIEGGRLASILAADCKADPTPQADWSVKARCREVAKQLAGARGAAWYRSKSST